MFSRLSVLITAGLAVLTVAILRNNVAHQDPTFNTATTVACCRTLKGVWSIVGFRLGPALIKGCASLRPVCCVNVHSASPPAAFLPVTNGFIHGCSWAVTWVDMWYKLPDISLRFGGPASNYWYSLLEICSETELRQHLAWISTISG
ncbi:hypothetical protein BU15DRAFT_65398 [Melanogaster broomeanus]|nr:hypothetical protein BU15DRAFT_65398 [Melanogaster broomeanus]